MGCNYLMTDCKFVLEMTDKQFGVVISFKKDIIESKYYKK